MMNISVKVEKNGIYRENSFATFLDIRKVNDSSAKTERTITIGIYPKKISWEKTKKFDRAPRNYYQHVVPNEVVFRPHPKAVCSVELTSLLKGLHHREEDIDIPPLYAPRAKKSQTIIATG